MQALRKTTLALLLIPGSLAGAAAEEPLPDAIAAPGLAVALTAHAQGMQIYECKAGSDGKLVWTFREPQATLTADDKVVGRHYAGPTWELEDGSAVVGKAIGNASGSTTPATGRARLAACPTPRTTSSCASDRDRHPPTSPRSFRKDHGGPDMQSS
jgi:hypothetical protein